MEEASERRPQGRGLSIHIGLNFVNPAHYAGWDGELAAAEFDAEDMRAIAEAQGFEATSLIRSDATREAVRSAFANAAAQLKGGDTLLINYSNHDKNIPNMSRDENDDNDET